MLHCHVGDPSVAFRHTRPGRLERPRGAPTSAAHDRGISRSLQYSSASLTCSEFVLRPSAAKSRLSITADPCTLDLVLKTPISTRFNVSAAFCVSVCLSFFACMPLNDVAILYKNHHVYALKYHPVLPLISVCSSGPSKLFASLSACSLSSTFATLFFIHCRPS